MAKHAIDHRVHFTKAEMAIPVGGDNIFKVTKEGMK